MVDDAGPFPRRSRLASTEARRPMGEYGLSLHEPTSRVSSDRARRSLVSCGRTEQGVGIDGPLAISNFLQAELRRRGDDEVPAVEAARWLDAASLLDDSASRPGLSLRKLLRAGAIAGADQRPPTQYGRWFIVNLEHGTPPTVEPPRGTLSRAGSGTASRSLAEARMSPRLGPPAAQPASGGGNAHDAAELADVLCRFPCTVADAQRPADAGGAPARSGMYAWWMSPRAIPGVSGPPHPAERLELLYVGIAPSTAQSRASLRSRVLRQHIGGNIGSSTFRQSLAALLLEQQGWTTRWSGSRQQLTQSHNRALRDWQIRHLRLSWAEQPRPWEVEEHVITLMQPPLNLAGNASHPLHQRLTALRAQLRAPS